jgi:transposase
MIREKAQSDKSAYAIAKEMGLSKNTVKKYIVLPAQDALQRRKHPSQLDRYEDLIKDCFAAGIFNCQVILERLKEAGYTGSISILKAYVKPYRPSKNLPAVPRYETAPGKQAQMDYGICSYIDSDKTIHKVPVFTMVMANSRARYVEFVKRCDFYSLVRCMVNAFEYFGGIPETILTDWMKTVVIGREGGQTIWNAKFAEFAKDMGFVPKLCKVRRPQTKGKVERQVRYVKENFLPGRTFTDLEDLNRQVMAWCRKADSRIHGSTGKIPLEELEKEPLLCLPPIEFLDRYRFETRKVSNDGFVSFDGIRYGVPWRYAGQELRVRLAGGRFLAFDGAACIAEHKVMHRSGTVSFLPGQYQGLVQQNGRPLAPAFGIKIPKEVEIRPLFVYDQIMEEKSAFGHVFFAKLL